jgi:hypothetical protein
VRRALGVCAAALALAACGSYASDEAPLPTSAPAATVTPPPADDLKIDLATAIRELETYRFSEGSYTEEESLLGPAFPPTVTVRDAGPDGFHIAAVDNQGIRYEMIRAGERDRRVCRPADPVYCPNGEW